jgi:F-type H+-transporting ATPase subunit delta
MKISKQAQREAKLLLRSCLVNGSLDEIRVRNAVEEVLAAKPRAWRAILSHFVRLLELDVARLTARIEAAAPLAPDFQARLQTGLASFYGPGLAVSFVQNPALIGGMRIKVASDVYDGSIQARLAALQESF